MNQFRRRKSPIGNRDEARIKQTTNTRSASSAHGTCTFALFAMALLVAADLTVIGVNETCRSSTRRRANIRRPELPFPRLVKHFDCLCLAIGRPCPQGSMRSPVHLSRGEFRRNGARKFATKRWLRLNNLRSLLGTYASDIHSRVSESQKPSRLKIVRRANENVARSSTRILQ